MTSIGMMITNKIQPKRKMMMHTKQGLVMILKESISIKLNHVHTYIHFLDPSKTDLHFVLMPRTQFSQILHIVGL